MDENKVTNENDVTSEDIVVYDALLVAWELLMEKKPNNRTDKDRRYQITITDFEKVMAYFRYYVVGVGLDGK